MGGGQEARASEDDRLPQLPDDALKPDAPWRRRPEVVRDNMGHANIDVTQNVYGKSWWDERVDAVTRAVEAVMEQEEKETGSGSGKESKQLEPFLEPQTV